MNKVVIKTLLIVYMFMFLIMCAFAINILPISSFNINFSNIFDVIFRLIFPLAAILVILYTIIFRIIKKPKDEMTVKDMLYNIYIYITLNIFCSIVIILRDFDTVTMVFNIIFIIISLAMLTFLILKRKQIKE